MFDQGMPPLKFSDPETTARGEVRAGVVMERLETLWFNTGTLCNIACSHCYMESGPRNDSLAYLTVEDMAPYLDEIQAKGYPTKEIAFTGGEPFMNPHIIDLLGEALRRGFAVLVLTNATKPFVKRRKELLALTGPLSFRVSLDHYEKDKHDAERGAGMWEAALAGLAWLRKAGFPIAVAGRTRWGEGPEAEREGYARLFRERGLALDAHDPAQVVLFPEMDAAAQTPEITTACWGILGMAPSALMCASSRMVVRRKGSAAPSVVACTLVPYDERFELGAALEEAHGEVKLNHPHCSKFCVLGGGSCKAG